MAITTVIRCLITTPCSYTWATFSSAVRGDDAPTLQPAGVVRQKRLQYEGGAESFLGGIRAIAMGHLLD
jgi:hypothetical protein